MDLMNSISFQYDIFLFKCSSVTIKKIEKRNRHFTGNMEIDKFGSFVEHNKMMINLNFHKIKFS